MLGGGGLGYGQTWQNMSGQRNTNVDYLNNSGKPIEVSVSCASSGGAGNTSELYVDGLTIQSSRTNSGPNAAVAVTTIVPNNSVYRAYCSWWAQGWYELR